MLPFFRKATFCARADLSYRAQWLFDHSACGCVLFRNVQSIFLLLREMKKERTFMWLQSKRCSWPSARCQCQHQHLSCRYSFGPPNVRFDLFGQFYTCVKRNICVTNGTVSVTFSEKTWRRPELDLLTWAGYVSSWADLSRVLWYASSHFCVQEI